VLRNWLLLIGVMLLLVIHASSVKCFMLVQSYPDRGSQRRHALHFGIPEADTDMYHRVPTTDTFARHSPRCSC